MLIDLMFARFLHFLCEASPDIFTPFFRLITLLGEKGWPFLLVAIILCLRKRTRWIGATIIGSIGTGYILIDLIIKPIIMRARPYLSSVNEYYQYWLASGAIEEAGYSMPSGHTYATCAFFVALFISCKKEMKKNILLAGLICVPLMIMSRCYFMHHHLTDCLVSILLALIIPRFIKLLVKVIYKICKDNEKIPFFNFIINFNIFQSND